MVRVSNTFEIKVNPEEARRHSAGLLVYRRCRKFALLAESYQRRKIRGRDTGKQWVLDATDSFPDLPYNFDWQRASRTVRSGEQQTNVYSGIIVYLAV